MKIHRLMLSFAAAGMLSIAASAKPVQAPRPHTPAPQHTHAVAGPSKTPTGHR